MLPYFCRYKETVTGLLVVKLVSYGREGGYCYCCETRSHTYENGLQWESTFINVFTANIITLCGHTDLCDKGH